MSRALIIIADTNQWYRLEDGNIVDQGRFDESPDPIDGEERIFLPGAAEIVLSKVDFASLTPAQARAAARLQLAGDSLIEAADLHVAVSDDGEWAATVSHAAMQSWTETHQANRIIPPQMLLAGSQKPSVLPWADGLLVASEDILAFVDEAWTNHFVAGVSLQTVTPDVIEARLSLLTSDSKLDLRQGEYAPRPPALISPEQKRLGLWLAVAAGLIAITIPTVQLVRLNASAAIAEDTASSRALAAMGGQGSAEQAISALDAKLSSLRGGGAGFGKTSQAVFAAMQQTAGVEAQSLQFLNDGQMTLQVKATKAEDIQQLAARMQAVGLIVAVGALNPAQSQPVTELRISGL
jgi:general secretion pathway protein L